MSAFGYGYSYQKSGIPDGDYRVAILSVDEKVSQKGNPMLELTLRVNGTYDKIRHYIVKNDWFNRNMSQFFDAFDIEDGDFDFIGWVGAQAVACVREDDRGYPKVSYFIRKGSERVEQAAPWDKTPPERTTVGTLAPAPGANNEFVEVDDDELPF